MAEAAPGSIAVWSDIGCPWAHLAVYRLHAARRRLGLQDQVSFDHRPFPLELFNERATPRDTVRAEVRVLAAHEPAAGWQDWNAPEWQWPVTTLPALEAVQGAAAQNPRAAEELDRQLRLAFFAESRCISLRHVILEVAGKCDVVDVDCLADALDRGIARGALIARFQEAVERDEIRGSPQLFLADGSSAHNPGISMHWSRDASEDAPVIDRDDRNVYEDLLRRAAGRQ